ncbi:formate/nitrite transporter family protein [Roseivirga sp. BDSF3-8]|uniref:formate/nitrite transporter family protein n=1 Tax=Roseivirga sp. BDSF3-8 TaxID=3241598 RepID=UPI003531EB7F
MLRRLIRNPKDDQHKEESESKNADSQNEGSAEEKSAKVTMAKEYTEILDEQLQVAIREHKRSWKGLLLSGTTAGLEIGFSIFLMGIVWTLFHNELSEEVLHLWLALSYPLGFIFVVIGRSELFTEHTNLAVLPVLDKQVSFKSLMVLWSCIFGGNLIGGYIFSFILTEVGPALGIISPDAFVYLAEKMTAFSSEIILVSAILAGWLMGLLSWLVTSSSDSISRIFVVVLVTAVIGFGNLHHSIVGSIEVFSGMLIGNSISVLDYLQFQLFTTLGNTLGGVFFVAVLKYSHSRYVEKKEEEHEQKNEG